MADSPMPVSLAGAPRSSLRSRLWASEREEFPLQPKESLIRWAIEIRGHIRIWTEDSKDEEVYQLRYAIAYSFS